MAGAVEAVGYSRPMSARGHCDWIFVTSLASSGAFASDQTPEERRDSPGSASARRWYATCLSHRVPDSHKHDWSQTYKDNSLIKENPV
jgi:hypothetical protein